LGEKSQITANGSYATFGPKQAGAGTGIDPGYLKADCLTGAGVYRERGFELQNWKQLTIRDFFR
jgi:hypothetical protein